jgi:hypothetical protein
MIKLVYCFTKKPALTDEEFFHYWEHVHGPIGARIPGVRRLVQSHRVYLPGDARGSDYDGMALGKAPGTMRAYSNRCRA